MMDSFYNQFFEKWCSICETNKKKLIYRWGDAHKYTNLILKESESITNQIGSSFSYNVFYEYYSIDAVFYSDEDELKIIPHNKTWTKIHGTWLKKIRIAFEHENNILGADGGYQEICHLLTTNAEHKVLVGYEKENQQKKRIQDFFEILKNGNDNQKILVILGDIIKDTTIVWHGFLISDKGHQEIKNGEIKQ